MSVSYNRLERDQLCMLQGSATSANHRDASGTGANTQPWKKAPTAIVPPSNLPLGRHGPAHTSGSNPYNVNPNRLPTRGVPRQAGNPTSHKTVANRERTVLNKSSLLPPPRKKQKTDQEFNHMPSSFTRSRDHEQPSGSNKHRPHLGPESIIDVDSEQSELPDDDTNRHRRRSSRDELNFLSPLSGMLEPELAQSSKYPFAAQKVHSDSQKPESRVARDGKFTEWAKEKYTAHQPSHPSSPITQFEETDTVFGPPGTVRQAVAKLDANLRKTDDKTRKINLADKMKPAKGRRQTKIGENLLDPTATSSTPFIQRPTHKGPTIYKALSLKEVCLDAQHYNDGLVLCWQNDNMWIKSGTNQIFPQFDIRSGCQSMTHGDSSDPQHFACPIIQLQLLEPRRNARSSTKVGIVTMKFDRNGQGWDESRYATFCNWLKKKVDNKSSVRPPHVDKLWETAEAEMAVPQGKKPLNSRTSESINRLGQLREIEGLKKNRSLSKNEDKPPSTSRKRSHSSDSLRYTPPESLNHHDARKPIMGTKESQSNLISTSNANYANSGFPPPRRSARNTISAKHSPPVDHDEVILVYPQGIPGAVNVTNGDLARLQPGEFLNDTLIEFGLKLWLKELEVTNPTLASQVHVFNSFFYKKLNHNKKGSNAGGYESVRKWTSKFDLFQKKYIIIPINEHLHWYLAIIYEPEHVLQPAASPPGSTRKQTRQSASKTSASEQKITTQPALKPMLAPDDPKDVNKEDTLSEAEVELDLNTFEGSCNIGSQEDQADAEYGAPSPGLSYVSDGMPDKLECRSPSPTASGSGLNSAKTREVPPFLAGDDMSIGALDDTVPMCLSDSLDEPDSGPHAVAAARFYQRGVSKKAQGKRKVTVRQNFAMDVDEDGDDEVTVVNDHPKTYIFTLDSLGSRHPQVVKKLSEYLKMEALHKKGATNPSSAEGKTALVPVQPNFCDCGLYLLHFAQKFMSNPKQYRDTIISHKTKSVPNTDRQVAWHEHEVTGRRESLAARILELSHEWKKDRVAKEEAKKKETISGLGGPEVLESSDSEIDIVETVPSASKGQGKSKGQKKGPATRLRGG